MIKLPFYDDEAAAAPASTPRSGVSAAAHSVLVVDDDEAAGRALAGALGLAGFRAAWTSHAHDVLSCLEREPVQLVLVDLMLCGTNGIELARSIGRRFPDVRVVLTSSYHLSERQLLRSDCGAVGFVPKPFDMQALTAFLKSKLDRA